MTFKRYGRAIMAAALAIAATTSASAAGFVGHEVSAEVPLTLNSNCGVDAVGIGNDGKRWAGKWADPSPTFDDKNNPQWTTAAVNNEGRWHFCQPWIKPGESPTTPQPDGRPCPGGTGAVAFWKVGPVTCSSYDPSTTDPRHPSRVQGMPSGEFEAFRAVGRQSGLGLFRCIGGQAVQQPGSTCVENPDCSGKVAASWGTGASCSATFEGRLDFGKSRPLASANGKGAASLYCNPTTGTFQVIGGTCRK